MTTATVGLGQTILNDLEQFGGWLETEAAQWGQDAWNLAKSLFASVSAEQITLLRGFAEAAIKDAEAGIGWEAIVTDILNRGAAAEVTWLGKVPTEIVSAIASLVANELKGIGG